MSAEVPAPIDPKVVVAIIVSVLVFFGGTVFFPEWTAAVGRFGRRLRRKLTPITHVQGLKLPSPTSELWRSTLDDDAADAARRLGTEPPAEYAIGNVVVRCSHSRFVPSDPTIEMIIGAARLDISREDVMRYVYAVHTAQLQRSIEHAMKNTAAVAAHMRRALNEGPK